MLEKKLGHNFKNKELLNQALTHTSVDNSCQSYERLEFLGDRVLGLVMADILFKKFGDESEGDLAKRHAALVQKKALYMVAESLELGQFLKLSDNESETGGRQKQAILADVVESLLGAIYMDSDYQTASKIINNLFKEQIENQTLPPQDPKTRLQEMAQAAGKGLPHYNVKNQTGPSHAPIFEIEVHVEGYPKYAATDSSKRAAEKKAAQHLINYLLENEKGE